MKTDFSIRVSIDLGMTEQLVEVVRMFLGDRGQLVSGRFIFRDGEQDLDAKPSEDAPKAEKSKKSSAGDRSGEPAPGDGSAAPAAAEPEAGAEQKPDTEDAKVYTEQDVREAMHRARQRIEGEDYKNDTDGEKYKKYHKQLTSEFKKIASVLGSDKPSTLPEDRRGSFISECNQLDILEDGTIGKPLPY